MRIVDTLIVFRILKMLTTPFNKMKAYKFGFIDKDGNRIKKIENEAGKMVPNDPFTKAEKASLTPLHRLVFNLKKIIAKVPFGKTQFAETYCNADFKGFRPECNALEFSFNFLRQVMRPVSQS